MKTLRQAWNALIYEYDGETLQIEPWGANSFRVRASMMREIEDSDYALLPCEPVEAKIQVEEYRAEITNGKLRAVMQTDGWRHRCRVSFYNQKDELLLSEINHGGALNLYSRNFQPILGGDFQLTVTFASNPQEKLFGMGQYQQDFLDIKGCNLELAHRNSQASVPFVLSSLGYGFLWHNPAIGQVNFGKNTTIWHAGNCRQMDYWITAGDTPAKIEQAYAGAVGKTPMMPEYGMGFWQCKLRYWNQEQLLSVAREYYRLGIPVDVIVCDFFHWPKMGDFRFIDEFFPNPEKMVTELADMGMKLMVSVWPQVDLESENYHEMRQKGYLVKTERGVEIAMRFGGESTFYDATNPKARDYVWEKCKQNYYDKGIQVFWLDEAEPEYSVYDFDNYRYYLGPNIQIGNLYPQFFARTFYEGQKAAGQDKIVNLIRCAWAGSQRYGALVWSGDIHSDWQTLRRQLCAGLNMGIAGIPWWTTDIGGFSGGNPDDEKFRQLLVRWFEWGCFCPVMRLHGDRDGNRSIPQFADGTPTLFSGGDNEVWSFGEQNTPILVKYIRLREAMRPYTRHLMEEAAEKGHPVMRTMFYEFPEDDVCWDLKEQYMYGSDLLVAPVVYENEMHKELYLPKGAQWTALHTGEVYEGGQMIRIDAPIDVIPVFARNGKCEDLIGRF
ncbi:MAG: glycoside hydrolase family 31 protein [Lachnospiraceae bacterium]|jgi:alpha-D-xyloside xylohydrolase|nr:glycoside hydrolase family 31 protein [Lachnospiraceae bacterium]